MSAEFSVDAMFGTRQGEGMKGNELTELEPVNNMQETETGVGKSLGID